MNDLTRYEARIMSGLPREFPDFGPGDTVRVQVRVVEGGRERLQAFEGVCIGRRGGGLRESFIVRKISHGEGVERVFPMFSPLVASVELVRRGRVRRAKLHYLRERAGKAARIAERRTRPRPRGAVSVAAPPDAPDADADDASDAAAASNKSAPAAP